MIDEFSTLRHPGVGCFLDVARNAIKNRIITDPALKLARRCGVKLVVEPIIPR